MTDRAARDSSNPPANAAMPSVQTAYLPRLTGPTIGRERELAWIGAHLRDPEIDLVTLLGPGGVGKTRLALEVARSHATDLGATWFVDLQHLTDPAQLLGAIARTFQLRDAGSDSTYERLVAWLQSRRGVLILDNFERLHGAEPLVVDLLSACPGLTILVTSRVPLHISGEHCFRVHPLACPAPDEQESLEQVLRSDAVRLFVLRASAVQPEFTLTTSNMADVAAICQRLDGLPLAIELAAARTRHMGTASLLAYPDQGLEVLSDGPCDSPPRMQSLRQAIAWSYDLLPAWQQRLFNQLSVFSGSFSLKGVEAVLTGEDEITLEAGREDTALMPGRAVQGLAALIDQSLVELTQEQGSEPRYVMLETLRQFGLEQLRSSGQETEIRDRHAAWCLAMVELAERARIGLAPAGSMDRLRGERNNIRMAFHWLHCRDEYRSALRMASALWPIWLEHGEISEGRALVSSLLKRPADEVPPHDWAQGCWVHAALAQAQGDHDLSTTLSRSALAIFEQIGDSRGAAAALTTLGLNAMSQGDHEAAARDLEESRTRFRLVNDPREGAWALRHLSSLAFRQGNITRAVALAEEGVAIVRTTGQALDLARLLLNTGHGALIQGDLMRAESACTEALGLFQRMGDRWGIADALQRLGNIAIERGQGAQAIELLEASRVLFEEVGDPEGLVIVLVQLAQLYRSQGARELAVGHLERGLAVAREKRNPSRLSSALIVAGTLAHDAGDWERAATAWKESLQLATMVHDRLATAAVLEWVAHLAIVAHPAAATRLIGAARAVRMEEHAPIPALVRTEHAELASRLEALPKDPLGAMIQSRTNPTLDAAAAEANTILDQPPPVATQVNPSRPADVRQAAVPHLSTRERETLGLLAKGLTNRQIADVLSISPRTVENHVRNVYDKLGLSSRAAATAFAIRHGLD